MHPSPGKSPSLQVPLPVLQRAAAEGFVSHPRRVSGETEVVVAFQPEATLTYLEMAGRLPAPEASEADVAASARAGSGEAVPASELPEGVERRRELRMIEAAVRDTRFRRQVIVAYRGRCAFCGLGGGLTQAAHIQGVAENGPDLVVNGLGACPTHHLAFDRGLITVDPDHAIEVSEEKLCAGGCAGDELDAFRAGLFDYLALPEAATDHPDPRLLAAHRERWQ
jgi:putative restriction endonuclease